MATNRKVLLLTGGAGFIGHHFCEHFHKNKVFDKIIIFDKLSYSGTLDRLRDIDCYPQLDIQVLTVDFSLSIPEGMLPELSEVTHIIHMGAETHVDNSISNPESFVTANVSGTLHMLQLARKLPNLKEFYYFSTDEVFGPAYGTYSFKENEVLNPKNPYAATKASGEMLCIAFANTYGLPVIITRTMNVFGERQHPEKFIPLCINKILKGEIISIHADSSRVNPGVRQYIHARNVASAYQHLIETGNKREKVFHIVGEKEVNNLELAKAIGKILGKQLIYELVDFHSSRPGHDLRYSLQDIHLNNLGWTIPKTFEQSLEKTVKWYLDNSRWLQSQQ